MNENWTTKKVDKYVFINKTLRQETISNIPKMIELIKREISILENINHPNIVRLFDVARIYYYLNMFLEHYADDDLIQQIYFRSCLSIKTWFTSLYDTLNIGSLTFYSKM
ncbi:unnamed protein product [Paramecium sonneborni]|uniref:Protein kinase domain-containing protein n=1 Tax=Paramecium sonneborni TaxID=65129 RepID=A0A8S1NYS1_9CILI|nr:unnamed protein product [Paramecium sonneborni]